MALLVRAGIYFRIADLPALPASPGGCEFVGIVVRDGRVELLPGGYVLIPRSYGTHGRAFLAGLTQRLATCGVPFELNDDGERWLLIRQHG